MNEPMNSDESILVRSPSLYQRLTLIIRKPKDVLDFMPMVSSEHKQNILEKIKRGRKKKDQLDSKLLLEDQPDDNSEDHDEENKNGGLSLQEEQQYAQTPVMSPSYYKDEQGESQLGYYAHMKEKLKAKAGYMKKRNFGAEKKRSGSKSIPPPHPALQLSLCTGQMIRSIGSWSSARKEQSLYNCMIHLIENSEHYIYIENQYFISNTANNKNKVVQNAIGSALVERIKRAMQHNQVFRVIIVMPVHPEGNLTDAKTLYVMKWQYRTISRGQNSILEQLRAAFPNKDPSTYISFYNLRQWGVRNEIVHDDDEETIENFCECEYEHDDEEPITEQIYVHSKLMIVDDLHVLIGSGNINDRSLMGDRDSEIAVLLTDTNFNTKGRMDGSRNERCGLFASSLRKRLWREHLGLMESDEFGDDLEADNEESEVDGAHSRQDKVIDVLNDVTDKFENLRLNLFETSQNIKSHIKDMKDKHDKKKMLSLMHKHQPLIKPRNPSLNDPISEPTYKGLWMKTAQENTAIFEEVFDVIPRDNKFETIDDFRRALRRQRDDWSKLKGKARAKIMHDYKHKLKRIKGSLVMCPLNFLSKEKFPKSGKLAPIDDSIFV